MSNSTASSSSPQKLYSAKNILKNYKKEEQLRYATKKQLQIIKETLQLEIQHQSSGKSFFLTFISIFFALIAIIIPFATNQSPMELQMYGKDYELINISIQDKTSGQINTYKEIKDDSDSNWIIAVILIYIVIMTAYYIWSSSKITKMNKIYNLARFVYSTK